MEYVDQEQKKNLIKRYTPSTNHIKTVLASFFVGGLVCGIGELIRQGFIILNIEEKLTYTLVSIIFIALASILTAGGCFDRIARFSCAGTLVPITGFSNSITSEAIDARNEGYVLGVGAKIFTVAGPVLLYGTVCGAIYGFVYYVFKSLSALG